MWRHTSFFQFNHYLKHLDDLYGLQASITYSHPFKTLDSHRIDLQMAHRLSFMKPLPSSTRLRASAVLHSSQIPSSKSTNKID